MKLIVDVPDEMIKALEQGCFGSKYSLFDFMGYVLNGTELPKEHGDLIDSNVLCEKYDMCLDLYQALDLTPVIIKGE